MQNSSFLVLFVEDRHFLFRRSCKSPDYTYIIKGECKRFLKNCQLTSYVVILGQGTFFSITKVVFRENMSFIYPQITFLKIAYYLIRLSQALKLTSL